MEVLTNTVRTVISDRQV
ncbi:hypothetical protein ACTM7X_01160 [Citrobacter braakii]